MRNAGHAALIAALTLAWTAAASAADYPTGFYVEGAVGSAQVGTSACDSLPGTLGTQFSCKDSDASWEVAIGWAPSKWAGFDIGYVDLGEARATAGGTTLTASADGTVLAVNFTAPGLEAIGLYGRFGVFMWDGELSGSLTIPAPPGVSLPFKSDGTATMFGVGFRWPLGDHIGIGLRWDRYMDIGTDEFFSAGKSDVDNYSARLTYLF